MSAKKKKKRGVAQKGKSEAAFDLDDGYLRKLRKNAGMTQEDLAEEILKRAGEWRGDETERSAITSKAQQISTWERGVEPIPLDNKILHVAQALGANLLLFVVYALSQQWGDAQGKRQLFGALMNLLRPLQFTVSAHDQPGLLAAVAGFAFDQDLNLNDLRASAKNSTATFEFQARPPNGVELVGSDLKKELEARLQGFSDVSVEVE